MWLKIQLYHRINKLRFKMYDKILKLFYFLSPTVQDYNWKGDDLIDFIHMFI